MVWKKQSVHMTFLLQNIDTHGKTIPNAQTNGPVGGDKVYINDSSNTTEMHSELILLWQ